jgi:hypothetical protein
MEGRESMISRGLPKMSGRQKRYDQSWVIKDNGGQRKYDQSWVTEDEWRAEKV